MISRVQFQLLLLGIVCCKVNGYAKNWVWSTKWNDARNWDKNRIPCSNDQIILAEGVIYLSRNTTMSNVELTTNGEIVLDNNMQLTVEETPNAGSASKDCPGEPIRFTGNTARDWFNPLNWNFIENGKVASWNDGSLYLDRIPCVHDNVYFPEANAFVVSLATNAKVGELYLGKQSYGNAQLATYLSSRQGKMSFKRTGNSQVTVGQKTCQQSVGCPCGYSKMKTTICSKFTCPPSCENKVTPEGDCCERCGAVVKMNISPKFKLSQCQNVLRRRLITMKYNKAMLFISPIDENNAVERVQILVTDKSDGSNAVAAAQETSKYLSGSTKAEECAAFNVKVITSKSGSGDGGNTGKSKGKSGSNSTTVALAVSFSLLLVIVILAALYLLHRRRNNGAKNTHVLHNELDISGSRHIEMKDTEFIKDVLDFDMDKGGASFDNPMYDDMMAIGPAVIEPQNEHVQDVEPVYAKPIRKSATEEDEGEKERKKHSKKKKEKKGKSSKSNGQSKVKKSTSNDAFENPVYGVQYTPDFDESFDASIENPVPGDTGFHNPLYGEVNPIASTDAQPNLDEAMATDPPSFLDVVGFTPPDNVPKISVEVIGEEDA
eukprot:gene11794-13014_t